MKECEKEKALQLVRNAQFKEQLRLGLTLSVEHFELLFEYIIRVSEIPISILLEVFWEVYNEERNKEKTRGNWVWIERKTV